MAQTGMQHDGAALRESGKENILGRNAALVFLCNQFLDLRLRFADASCVLLRADIVRDDVIPGTHHVTAVDGDWLHRGMREDIAHRNRQLHFLCDRNEVGAICTEPVQPDDAVLRGLAGFETDMGKQLQSILRQDFAQRLEDLAVTPGRLVEFFFLVCVADQRTQMLGVGTGMGGEQFGQCGVAFQQTLAPLFQLMQMGCVLARGALPGVQPGHDGSGVHFAHQLADELNLPPSCAELVDALDLADGIEQAFRQVQLEQLAGIQRHQLLADLLQVVHLLFDPGLAWRRDMLFVPIAMLVGVLHGDEIVIGCCYDSAFHQSISMKFNLMNSLVSSEHRFSQSPDTLRQIARDMLRYARQQGATACAAEASDGFGQAVTVRRGEVETIEYNRDKGLSVSVYIGQRRGNANTSDFSARAVRETVDAALAIARYTASDDCAGLPDMDMLATEYPDLDLYHPWLLDVEQAIDLARECEQAALARDRRISNSEGATVNVHESQFVYANSLGFSGGFPSSRHSIGCAVIAGKGTGMQRDYWYSEARNAAEMLRVDEVGRIAAERALRRLKSRKLGTVQAPVLYEAPVAASLLGHFVNAVSGGSLYRKSSFLLDQLGQPVFSKNIRIDDIPDIPRGLASSAFDNEGVRTQRRAIVDQGVLHGYFLGTYSARKLGMKTTGNAGGNHNLIVRSGQLDFEGLLKQMNRGLVVTELLGQGVNHVTGDYSRGAAGFWVEHGEIQYPVEEITIAGNLKDMYRNIAAVGNDVLVQGSRQCGSILVEGMMVAGQ